MDLKHKNSKEGQLPFLKVCLICTMTGRNCLIVSFTRMKGTNVIFHINAESNMQGVEPQKPWHLET